MKHLKKVIPALMVTLLVTNFIYSMPIELASFTSAVYDLSVELKWSTVSEFQNTGFNIERRRKISNTWSVMGFVPGYGTTNEPQYYSYTDAGLAPGTYLYRLKQVDSNGQFHYYDLSLPVKVTINAIGY